MSMKGNVELKLAFLAQDEASAVISKLQKKMKTWSGQVKKGGKEANEFSVIMGNMKNSWTDLNSKVEVFTGAVDAARAAIDSVVQGEVESNVGVVFEQLAGNTARATAAMEQLRAVSMNTVGDVALQQFANQMMFTGQKLDSIMVSLEAGSTIALATGQDVVQVATQIAKAMNTGEAETLKNLGLTVDINREMREYARSLGKVAGTLTLAERVVVMSAVTDGLKRQMSAAGVNAAKMETTLQSMRSSLENATSGVGQFAAGLAGAGAEWVGWESQSIEWRKSIDAQTDALIRSSAALEAYRIRTVETVDAWSGATAVTEEYGRKEETVADAMDQAPPLASKLTSELGLQENRIHILTTEIALAMRTSTDWESAVRDLAKAHKNAADEVDRHRKMQEGQKEMAIEASKVAQEAAKVQSLTNEIARLEMELERELIDGKSKRTQEIERSILAKQHEIATINNTMSAEEQAFK